MTLLEEVTEVFKTKDIEEKIKKFKQLELFDKVLKLKIKGDTKSRILKMYTSFYSLSKDKKGGVKEYFYEFYRHIEPGDKEKPMIVEYNESLRRELLLKGIC